MAESAPSLHIGTVTVRGRAVAAERGTAIATALAPALAARLGTSVDRLHLRLPASAIRPDGGIDPAALAAALDRGGARG